MCDKNTRIKEWVDFVLKNYDVCNYQIEVEGQTDEGDGYSGDINFIKVTGFTKNGDKKTLNLVIKSPKRQQKTVREVYKKEMFIYNDVNSTFEKFLNEKKVNGKIDFVPYCYGTILNEDYAVVILENLRTQGFQLWDRMRPVTAKHAQLALEAYGKWHAFSMALKTQKPEIFAKLLENNVNMFSYILDKLKLYETIGQEFENARKLAIGDDEHDILKHLQYSGSEVKFALSDMFFEDPETHVILHGDSWNSNFLFKCSDDETNPSEVRIIDWQCSGVGSVAFDLSHFIFSCVDNGQYENVNELLKMYYESFSKQLIVLGCEPNAVYSFEKLVEQWKKFSHFGLFVSCWDLRISFTKKRENPEEETQDASHIFVFKSSRAVDDRYVKRIRNNFLQYCNSMKM